MAGVQPWSYMFKQGILQWAEDDTCISRGGVGANAVLILEAKLYQCQDGRPLGPPP